MKSKLGVYYISLGGVDVVDYIAQAKPRILVSMEHKRDIWTEAKKASPNTFIVGRYYVDDPEQNFEDDPEGRAEKFFNLIRPDAENMRGLYDAWMSYNEVDLGKDAPDAVERAKKYSRFHVRWGDLMKAANLKSAAYSFATGNPEVNLWEPLAEGLRHCDYLSLHEYSARKEPAPNQLIMDKDVTWLCLRYRRAMDALPADARRPIVITECGIDGGPVGEAQKGWSKFTDAAGYLSNLQWYDNELQKDDYLIGAVIYAMNGWGIDGSFGMGEVGMIRDYIAQGGDPGPVMTKMPGTVPAKPPAPPPQPVKPTQPAPPQPAKPTQPAPTAPTTGASTYTVQPGDTLFAIARKLGVTVQAITAANNITNPSLIKPGQVLTIPKK